MTTVNLTRIRDFVGLGEKCEECDIRLVEALSNSGESNLKNLDLSLNAVWMDEPRL